MNPCKVQSYLTAYVLGDLEPKKAEAIRKHLASCTECRNQAEAIRKTLSLLKEAYPSERAQPGEAPVLDPERRQQLLSVKPVVKPSAFLRFIDKAYRPLRMIAATLICVFGVLAILKTTMMPSVKACRMSTRELYNNQTFKTTISGAGGGGGYYQAATKAEPDGFAGRSIKNALSDDEAESVKTEVLKSEMRDQDADSRMDGTVAHKGKARAQAGEKSWADAGGVSIGKGSSVISKAKQRERYDDGLEANNPVPAPAAAPEPISPQPAVMDAVSTVKSPVVLRGVYASRSGSAKLALKGQVSAPEGAAAAAPVPAETAARPPAPATPQPESGRLERDKEVAAPEKSLSSIRYGLAVPKSAPGRVSGGSAGQEAAERQMEGLKIQAAKPSFAGTPKDIRSANLEKPGEREYKPADYPVVSYERGPDSKIVADGALTKSGSGTLSLGDTVVTAGTLVTGKRESKLAEAPQKEEEISRKRLTLVGGNTFAGGILTGEADSKLDALKDLKKEKANATADVFTYSFTEAAKDESKLGFDQSRRNLAIEKKLEEHAEAADLRKKPEQPREPLPFNTFVVAAAEPFSTFAMDVDTASYTLTRQALRSGKLPDPERVRLEEIVNAFDYGDTAPDRATFRVYQDGAQSPFGAGYNLLRIGVKGLRLGREEQRPAMLTLVLDVSGSMSQPDRIGFARLSLSSLLEQMGTSDRIQIIAYSDQARIVVEATPASDKARIMAAVDRLQCNGSTNLEEGLRRAYEQAVRAFIPGAENRVILISDGVANLGADSAQEILDKVAANRKQGITCSVFGVGTGTYNDKMLEELANKGDGVYRFLDSAEAVKTAFVDDLAATLNTIAKDAKIQVEWNPKTVKRYRQMGYENRKLTKEQFRDDTVDAGEVGSGQSVTALYELELLPEVTPESSLGTVRIRYQRTDNGKVEEIEAALLAGTVLRPAHQASVHFKVAASAAEFAELLRGSPHAQGGNFDAVADYLRPAALERTLDTRIKELLELVTTAASLTK